MKGSAGTEGVQRQMLRIVALLFALAGLAEQAAGRSQAVQRLVTWFLRRGEAVARDYVLALTGRAACGPAPTVLPHSGPAEALRLAASFRALAAALSALLEAVATASISTSRASLESGLALTAALASLAGRSSAVERRDSS